MAELQKQEIKSRVITVVSEILNTDPKKVQEAQSFDQLGADSLDMVEIVMRLEEEFSVEINDEKAQQLTSLDHVVEYIATLLAHSDQ